MFHRYPAEQRERATRMALERLDEYGSAWAVAQALGPKLGIGAERLRKWVLLAQVDAGGRRAGRRYCWGTLGERGHPVGAPGGCRERRA
jgi:transposase-like protein